MDTLIAVCGSIVGVVVGVVLQSLLSKRDQQDTRLAEWRNMAYTDFLNAAALVATAQRHGKTDEIADHLARLADAKTRICIYGDAQVIKELAEFWRHGATLQTESEILSFTRVCLKIRESLNIPGAKIYSPDISQLLFSTNVANYPTPKGSRERNSN